MGLFFNTKIIIQNKEKASLVEDNLALGLQVSDLEISGMEQGLQMSELEIRLAGLEGGTTNV